MERQQREQQQNGALEPELPKTALPSLLLPKQVEKAYTGFREADGICRVYVEEPVPEGSTEAQVSSRPLPLCLQARNHSPAGFEWGYGGSGPAQLALALLMDASGDQNLAMRHYQQFKFSFVAGWEDSWRITQREILSFLAARENLAGCEGAGNACPDC
ncbi:MAG: hypothetical protein C5B50_05565 [Verrucomicrobia bacterium]|nr:MAG: hypothetical protein C5B50_05565 [Verrucomicrobiota bacterium]